MKVTMFLPYQGHDIEVVVTFTASYTPARLNGLPEDCYPEDSELDIEEMHFVNKDGCELSDKELEQALVDEHIDRIEEECWDHFHDVCRGY
jgi:hypothetical protein